VAKKPKAGSERPPSVQRSAPWRLHFFQRHQEDDAAQAVPGREFLERCPVAARMAAVLKAVAEAPPNAFAGGGYWEAMHGTMAGYYEVRVDGRDRRHYRLFCVLERDGADLGLGGPSLVVIAGMEKPFRTKLSERDYARVRQLGDEYRSRVPRSVLR
jgi:Txe/YoeB family toxin of Txe-Axe toxin-antitoxin module